jgi:hypothetical protein
LVAALDLRRELPSHIAGIVPASSFIIERRVIFMPVSCAEREPSTPQSRLMLS